MNVDVEMIGNFIILCFAVILVMCGWRVLNWVWLRPKRLEKILRQQGFKGNSYRFLFGDMRETAKLIGDAKSKPISLSDDIVPRVVPHLQQTITNYGKYSFIWLGPRPMVLIMDPELVKEILSKNFHYQKVRSNPLSRSLVKGVVSYDGQKWVKHRKIINPPFHMEKLKHMLPAFHLSCEEMVNKWEKMISTRQSCELDVWPYLQTLTSDAISRTAFGSNYEEGRRIFELQKEQADLVIQASRQIYVPGYRFLPTPRNTRMKKLAKEVEILVQGLISKRLKAMEVGKADNDDLLNILLESNLKEMQQHGNKNSGMSIAEVIQECELFYFAGQETTSTLLVWTMILLGKHQNWQSRAREEVLKLFGESKPTFDGLNHLKIVTMILYEVLRLYPPLVQLVRTIHSDTKLGDVTFPAEVILSLPAIFLHHDPKLWGDDVKEFKPERFSEGVSNATKGHASFFPFGWGPRICIGQNFALLEAKMAMAIILQRFSFELSPSYAHTPHTMVTLQPQHGAHLIVKKLQLSCQ